MHSATPQRKQINIKQEAIYNQVLEHIISCGVIQSSFITMRLLKTMQHKCNRYHRENDSCSFSLVMKFTLLGILRFSTGLRSAMLSWGLFRPCQNQTHCYTSNAPESQVTLTPFFSYDLFPPSHSLLFISTLQHTAKSETDGQISEADMLCCVQW